MLITRLVTKFLMAHHFYFLDYDLKHIMLNIYIYTFKNDLKLFQNIIQKAVIMTWMNLEYTLICEISQRKKVKYFMVYLWYNSMWNLRKPKL